MPEHRKKNKDDEVTSKYYASLEEADLSHATLNEIISSPTVTDVSLKHALDTLREKAREHLASKLLWFVGLLYGGFLIVGAFLVYTSKITFRDLLDLILALGAFSGLLGIAINFYFKH